MIGKFRIYRGFVIARDGGPDAPWRAWREDGVNLRSDRLAGIKAFVRDYVARESV